MSIPAGALKAIGRFNIPLYRLSRGRLMGTVAGVPVLLLTSTGRRSGQLRTAPVLFAQVGDSVAVIGSNAGNTNEPAWSLNLKANPDAEVEIRGSHRPVRARITEGQERAEVWRTMNRDYPGFDRYDERTSRDIAVFLLEAR
jgi:F420H(2)-dependent quinone reductase